MTICSSCQAEVPEDALFCSQCGAQRQPGLQAGGFDLATAPTNVVPPVDPLAPTNVVSAGEVSSDVPPTNVAEFEAPMPGEVPATNVDDPLVASVPSQEPEEVDVGEPPSPDWMPTVVPSEAELAESPPQPPDLDTSLPSIPSIPYGSESPEEPGEPEAGPAPPPPPVAPAPVEPPAAAVMPPTPMPAATQIQQPVAKLLHVRTNTPVEIPPHLTVVHIGKPNERIPPDIDVSGFPDGDVVSRVHADIRVDPNGYYLEDSNSSNGTYVNNQPLRSGDRYLLRPGDRISLGKEDKVSFIFQV